MGHIPTITRASWRMEAVTPTAKFQKVEERCLGSTASQPRMADNAKSITYQEREDFKPVLIAMNSKHLLPHQLTYSTLLLVHCGVVLQQLNHLHTPAHKAERKVLSHSKEWKPSHPTHPLRIPSVTKPRQQAEAALETKQRTLVEL
ncbi:hypothetical protein X975_23402, partial [Stegodyphus mimosarum]